MNAAVRHSNAHQRTRSQVGLTATRDIHHFLKSVTLFWDWNRLIGYSCTPRRTFTTV